MWAFAILITIYGNCIFPTNGLLSLEPTIVRETISLDGLWYFTTDKNSVDFIEEANDLDINLMPVPSSYNDITVRESLRDHVGSVWYKRIFQIPDSWIGSRIWIRFGSVCYSANVTINGNEVVSHKIGHLPFEAEITSALEYNNADNVIVVEVNNILTNTTIPQGSISVLESGRKKLEYDFDFFNYAGIDRPVIIYKTSDVYIKDLVIKTDIDNSTGLINYSIDVVNENNSLIHHEATIFDKSGNFVISVESPEWNHTLSIVDVILWWPYLMDPNPGYLYTLDIKIIHDSSNQILDHYRQPFGVRVLKYDNDSFTINGEKIYIAGFGRHEDSDIRGKGLDLSLTLRDYNLIKWVGANCFRTSHYPYAEEIMNLADQLGIMIIDEAPAVALNHFNSELLKNHKQALTEMYNRDKNRPSVILWSIANEPQSGLSTAKDYFKDAANHMKSLDRTRPMTIACNIAYNVDHSAQYVDIVAFNRYQGWYVSTGNLDEIVKKLIDEAQHWRSAHNKPVFMTEYGADSLEGYNMLPSYLWSVDYQDAVMSEYFQAFDQLRQKGWFIGEMIWNFADFKTDQKTMRAGGNKKGIFTRNRQPKSAAYLLRKRYWLLAETLYENVTLPDDLNRYIINSTTTYVNHNEL